MRLATCIAFELAVAGTVVGGAGVLAVRSWTVGHDYLGSPEAAAATSRATSLLPLPSAELRVAPPDLSTTVFPAPDDVLLAPLGKTPVAHVKLNHGGTSLSLRVEFASGARAAFKPQQVHPQSDPRKEIAAYRIDRLLHIGHVAPAIPIALPVDEVVAAAEPAYHDYTSGRIASEAITRDGIMRGELSWWIPEIRDISLDGVRVDDDAGVAQWTQELQIGGHIVPEHRGMLTQLAACLIFDVLIDNADRWSGNNTKGSPDNQTLYFMDNTLSFSLFTWGHETNLKPLRKVQVFPRGLVERVRALTLPQLAAALEQADDAGIGPLLSEAEQRAVLARRDHLLAYIDDLIAEFGDDAVLALP
jgi:hypothetical protein